MKWNTGLRLVLSFVLFTSCLGGALSFFREDALAAAPSVVSNVVPVPADGSVALTWSTPASVDFTGTMVRYSTTAFPTTTSDGTLAGDVAGSPSSTSTLTVNGLTNGTTYYFSLFSHNAIPEYSAAVNTQQLVMDATFTEDFQSRSVASIAGQNGWSVVGGTWTVLDTAGAKTLQSSATNIAYNTNRVLNGGTVDTYTDQMIRADWKGTSTATPGQVFLRAQSASADAGGYFLWQSTGTLRINYKTSSGTAQTQLASVSFTPSINTWYTYEFSVVNNSAGLPVLTGYVWQKGTAKPSTPTIQVTDTVDRFPQGVFSIGKTGTAVTEYDNVEFYGRIGVTHGNVTPGYQSNTLSWQNPTFTDYSGSLIRVSTSSYPTTITDGTLVANVAGTSAGSSSTTHTGLTNGTEYYYTLFPYDSTGAYGTPLYLKQVAYPSLFTENYNALSVGSVVDQNNWTAAGGTWSVADYLTDRVLSGTGTATTYPTNKATNGNGETTDQILSLRFLSDTASNSAGWVWLRYQGDGSGYLVWHNTDTWSIGYYDATIPSLTTLTTASVTATPPMKASTWFNLEVSVINNGSNQPVIKAYVWEHGTQKPTTPNIQTTDSTDRFVQGTFALGRTSGAASAMYDDIAFYGDAPAITITSPAASVAGAPDVATRSIIDEDGTFYIPYIQTSSTLAVTASAGYVPSGGGVEFVLNEGLGSEQTVIDLSSPYTASFSGLAKAEYTVDAYVLDSDGVTHLSVDAHDTRTDVGIGDIITVIGDSITEGYLGTRDTGTVSSWLDADAGLVSTDNRNFPQYINSTADYGTSYLVDLNNQLSAFYGYPVFLMNEGRGGIRASNYASTVMDVSWQNRQLALDANKWILALGNNDANQNHSAATYRADMESLITTLTTTYGASAGSIHVPYPFYDFRSCCGGGVITASVITTYNTEIDDMRSDLGLAGGADLFNTFQNYQSSEYGDLVHPNATGYVRMARLWALALMQPTVTPSVSGRQITLSWDDLSADQPTISGYRVRYGTAADTLNQTLTLGNVTTTTFTNLAWNTTYYFDVAGFDNDPTDISYTDSSSVVSATTAAGSSTITPSAVSGSATEAGGTATFTVVLNNQPSGDVTFSVTSSDLTEGTVSPSSLTFTSGNWSTPQTVTVTGVNDDVDDGDIAFSITLGAATSSDSTFNSVNPSDPSITTTDNDTAGITISETGGTTLIPEAGGTDTFTAVLTSKPTADVTLNLTYASGDFTSTPSTLTFTDLNWNVAQTIILTSQDDIFFEGDEVVAIHLSSLSPDTLYNALTISDISALVLENDPPDHRRTPPSLSPLTRVFSIFSPNSSSVFTEGELITVRWIALGRFFPFTLDISTDDGVSWTTKATNIANTGSTTVTLPAVSTTTARIRLTSGTGPGLASAVSDAFTIIAQESSEESSSEDTASPGTPTSLFPPSIPPSITPHQLLKLADDGDSTTPQDATVYYVDAEGVRHPFRDANVFFSWYCSWDTLKIVTPEDLATIPLGTNITERPGSRLVKFATDPRVYAVDTGGILRWISDEQIAITLFGAEWTSLINETPDSFYKNFSFGSPITSSTSYSRDLASESAMYPSDILDINGYTPVQLSQPFSCSL